MNSVCCCRLIAFGLLLAGCSERIHEKDSRLSQIEPSAERADVDDLPDAPGGISRRAPENSAPVEDLKIETNSIGMKMTLVPPGEFLMGADEDEVGSHDETPHQVRITQPFYMGICEVTQEEYERVMGTNPSHLTIGARALERFPGLDTRWLPVEQVSWENAVEFCRQLSARPEEQRTGRCYRLPTEAEWEYACRAGTTTAYFFGRELNGGDANFESASAKDPRLRRTTLVGSYQSNAFGLYDMHGNVSEWCSDWYDANYYNDSPVDDPSGPALGRFRVIRGGCYIAVASICSSAFRDRNIPSKRDYTLGFRVARSVGP